MPLLGMIYVKYIFSINIMHIVNKTVAFFAQIFNCDFCCFITNSFCGRGFECAGGVFWSGNGLYRVDTGPNFCVIAKVIKDKLAADHSFPSCCSSFRKNKFRRMYLVLHLHSLNLSECRLDPVALFRPRAKDRSLKRWLNNTA